MFLFLYQKQQQILIRRKNAKSGNFVLIVIRDNDEVTYETTRDEINDDNVCQSAKQYIVLPTSLNLSMSTEKYE